MSAHSARGYLGISEVLAQLRADFPDVSVSKIRFLETEGLITPARSPAGYRRFCAQDVDRLRLILTAQRDQYLPLRVIRERLARLDQQAAEGAAGGPPAGAAVGITAGLGSGRRAARPGEYAGGAVGRGYPTGRAAADGTAADGTAADRAAADRAAVMLSRRELVEGAEVSEALLTELETFGLVRRIGRHYAPEALEVARTAAALSSFGVEARHLRSVRAAAERETAMIESLVAPILRQRGPGARELAGRTARDCAGLVLRLHGALVEGTLAEAGLPVGRLSQPALAGPGEDGARAHARGVEGASA